ncbi:hypothetical protein PGRAN_11506, partial [Listeria grandensis FSL F6-0971]
MKNKKALKMIVTATVAANVLASTFITAAPGMAFAAENSEQGTSIGTKAETKLTGETRAVLNNLVVNPQFNGMTGWQYGTNLPAATTFTPGKDGSLSITTQSSPGQNTAPYVIQQIPTIVGHKYRVTATLTDIASSNHFALRFADEVAKLGEPNSGGWFTITGTNEVSFEATADSSAELLCLDLLNRNMGGTFKFSNVSIVDLTAVKTTINAISTDSTVATGEGQPGETVTIKNGTTTIKTGTVDANGDYSVTIPKQAYGSIIAATVASSAATTVVAQGAIAPTTINSLTSDHTNVSGKGEPGATVVIKNGSTQVASGIVAANGTYAITIPKQAYGSTVTATVTLNGKTSSASTVVTQETLIQTTINAITTQQTNVSGTGEPGAAIIIKNDATMLAVGIVPANGQYNFVISKQAANSTVVATVMKNDQISSASTVVVKNAPSTPVLDTVTDKSTKATGTGDPGNTITIKIKDGDVTLTYIGLVDDFGEFSIPIDTPNAGATVDAIAKDQDNILSEKVTQTVIDVTAPNAPTVEGLNDTSTKITGKGEANAVVTVTLASGGTIIGETDANGNFSITIPKQAIGKQVSVAITDVAGNTSTTTVVTVEAAILANPTVNRVSNQDTKITGTGVAGATVTVNVDGKNYTGTVDTNGNYEIAVPKLAAGLEASVQQTKDGKTSGVVKTIVQDDRIPSAPQANTVSDTDTKATGTGTAGDTITIKLPSGGSVTGIVAPNGTWSITIPKQAAGAKLEVTATSPQGKASPATTITVEQQAQSGSLTANDFTVSGDKYITGTYSGDVAKISMFQNGTEFKGAAMKDGEFSFYAADKKIKKTDGNHHGCHTIKTVNEL